EADMDRILEDFVNAVRNADGAGFDMVELHMAHGYLLSGFISPYTNRRTDRYGGSIENRMCFPLRVVRAVRETLAAHKPISARISATDWLPGGLAEADLLALCRMLREVGVDVINVSTGQVAKEEQPVYGRMYQVPYADLVRNDVGIPTIVAGNITTADQVNTLVAAGRTDIVALARPIMNNPQFVLNMAARYAYKNQFWPPQYLSGKFAAELKAERDNAEELELRLNAKPPNPREALGMALARGGVPSPDPAVAPPPGFAQQQYSANNSPRSRRDPKPSSPRAPAATVQAEEAAHESLQRRTTERPRTR
ncbi:MAG: hypothetical protein HYY36_03650, partial [Gammaproteobacteria bacterium]|nr:hypothetical protein [Gammaproteobacteria bacterium]